MSTDDEKTLRQLEERRCKALMAGDAETLAALLAENLVHIHLNGQIDTKEGYLHGFRDVYTFRSISRGALTIRFFGDAAVMTGALSQTIEVRASGDTIDVSAVTTQVWNRSGGGWVLNTCHNAPLPKA